MPDNLLYLSLEWKEKAEKKIKAELSPEKMNYATSSLAYIYLNCPDGKERYIYFNFKDGTLRALIIGEGAPMEAEFKIAGDYVTFVKISLSELDSQSALLSGKLKLKGNMLKAFKLAPVCDRLNKVLSSIPTQY